MFQKAFLKNICTIYLFVYKLLGLWPFTYDAEKQSFSWNIFYAILPLILVPFYSITSLREISFLLDQVNLFFHNIVLRIASNAYMTSSLTFSIFIYCTQYRQHGRIKKLFHKVRKLTNSLDQWLCFDELNYLPQLIKFTLRTFVFSIMYEAYHFISIACVAPTKFNAISTIAFVLPNFVIKFYPDIFYGGMLATHFCFHRINKEIRHIIDAAIDSERANDDQLIGNLSNKMENVTVHYFELIDSTKEFVSLISFRVLLWLFISLLNFVVHIFMQYVFIDTSFRYGQALDSAISIVGLAATVLQFFEFWLTTSVCSKVLNEISATETMLLSMYIRRRHNDRFKEIVTIDKLSIEWTTIENKKKSFRFTLS